MKARQLAELCARSVVEYRPRAILAVVGIAAGSGTMLVALASAAGARDAAVRDLGVLGTDTVVVRRTAAARGSSLALMEATAAAVGHVIDSADAAGLRSAAVRVTVGSREQDGQATAVTRDWPSVARMTMAGGRWFTDADFADSRRVAVMGASIASELGVVDALSGAQARLDGEWYRVVGILAPRGRENSATATTKDLDRSVLVPLPSWPASQSDDCLGCIDELVVRGDGDARRMAGIVRSVLRQVLGIDPASPDGFDVVVPEELVEAQLATRRHGDLLLLVIGALALAIGGIGTTNVMLANVRERRAEIGLRRAVGATSRDIARQFGLEAVALSIVGGLSGLLAGFLTTAVIGHVTGAPMAVGVASAVVSLVSAVMVGVLAGLWPAARAGRLTPMTALREE